MIVRDKNFNYFHFLVLVHLLENGGRDNYLEITSSQISLIINRSQQTASKVLLDLERDSYIERVKNNKKFGMKLTEAGFEVLRDVYDLLKKSIEKPIDKLVQFRGKIVTGMGEGAYYMSLEGYKKQFLRKLGYEPFPGTLNVKLEDKHYINSRRDLINHPSIYIEGFKNKDRTFGWVKCYAATILQEVRGNYNSDMHLENNKAKEVHILLLERTHHDNSLIEVIGPQSIKDTYNLKNGDSVIIKMRN